MCRTTAAPLMAMAGMAGTAVGFAIAVIREKADRLSIEREAQKATKQAREASAGAVVESSDVEEAPGAVEDSPDR
jgi:uncharacterized membrane protein